MRILFLFISLLFLHEDINITGEYVKENIVFVYGSYDDKGYLLSYDVISEEIYFEYIFKDKRIMYLADTIDGFVLVVKEEDSVTCEKYNYQGLKINEVKINLEVTSYHNHHGFLILVTEEGYCYVDHDLIISNELELVTLSLKKINIQYQGNAYINEEKVDEIEIYKPGFYDIHIIDGEYSFKYQLIIRPEIIYYNGIDTFSLVDGMIFDQPIQIFTKDCQMRLNHEVYESQYIEYTGEYILEIFNEDQMIDSIGFTILPKLEGLIEGEVQQQRFYVFGDATLNGEMINGYCYVKEPGTYTLNIYYEEVLYETYEFNIPFPESNDHLYIYLAVAGIVFVSVIKFVKK